MDDTIGMVNEMNDSKEMRVPDKYTKKTTVNGTPVYVWFGGTDRYVMVNGRMVKIICRDGSYTASVVHGRFGTLKSIVTALTK